MVAEEDAEIASPETEDTSPQTNGEMTYLVKERFEIYYNEPLPELDANGAKAYEAKDKINPQRQLFVLICDNDYPPRLSILPYLKSIDHPGVLKLVEYSTVFVTPQKTHNMALIYAKPKGPKASTMLEQGTMTYSRFKTLVLSMCSACEVLKNYNITHRAIRLDNMFFKDASCEELVLGDCAASFPALFQNAAQETINNMLSLPEGRGNGTPTDDMYSVGAVMLGLCLGHEITSPLTNTELINLKIKKGSYTTLLNAEKISAHFSAIIKALLEDNEDFRWSYMQIYNFLEGKSTTFTPGEAFDRSVKALTVNNEKLYNKKSVALAMLDYPDEALILIKNGKLQDWVKSGLEDEKLYTKIDKLVTQSREREDNKFLVQQICICIDSGLPIKSGDIFVFPNGVSKAIFYSLKNGKNLDAFYSLLGSDLVKLWYQEQPNMHSPSNSGELKLYISRSDYGYGIDRVMYDFDEDLPCISPLLGKEFINTPARLLRALDDNYSKNKDVAPFDKNIIAYLRSKLGKKIDGLLTDINAHQDTMQMGAIIRLYATIQNKSGPVQLINLTKWLMHRSRTIIESYHNIKYQKFLERELVKVSKSGKIIELYEILENEGARQKDRMEYTDALKKINVLMSERNRIQSGSIKLDEEARDLAWRFAGIVSVLTMLSSFVLSVLYWTMR